MRWSNCRGSTGLEVFVVTLVVAVLTFITVLALCQARPPRNRWVACVSNLKQIGLGFRMWSNDHGEKFPWEVSTNEGGTFQYAESSEVWRHFQAASNELHSLKILACPADFSRYRAAEWSALRNTNISYFVSMNTDPAKPARVLAGDRFVSTNNKVVSGLLVTSDARKLRLVPSGHHKVVNIALADGSVNQLSTGDLPAAFSNQAVRLAIP